MLMKLYIDWSSSNYSTVISTDIYDKNKIKIYSQKADPLDKKEAYSVKDKLYDPNFKNLANIIDTYNVTEVECSDYLGELFVNSYIGNEFTFSKRASDCLALDSDNNDLMNNLDRLKLFISQSFIKEKSEKWHNTFYFNKNMNFGRFCKTLLANMDNNINFFKDMINEGYNHSKGYCCEITQLLLFCLMISSNNCLITKEQTKKYFDDITSLITKNKNYNYCKLFNPSYFYSPTFNHYDIKEIEDCYNIRFNKVLSQIIIDYCVQYAINSKNKVSMRFLDDFTEFIVQACIEKNNYCYYHWKFSRKEEITECKKLIDITRVDFSSINNYDKFINMIVNKNKRKSKPKEALLFGYLICPDKFNWSEFNTQVILNYLPENPKSEKEVNKIPLKYFDSIDALSRCDNVFISRGFTFLNMIDEKTLKDNIDLISYNIFKSINASRYLYTIFVNKNIYYKDNNEESKLINENNMKIVFNGVSKYYAENGNKRQILKYLEFLDECFPKDFIKLDYPKIKKVIMENKLKK